MWVEIADFKFLMISAASVATYKSRTTAFISSIFLSFAKTVVLRTAPIFRSRCGAEHLEQEGEIHGGNLLFYKRYDLIIVYPR